jgi:aminoglycoside phosphotransferase
MTAAALAASRLHGVEPKQRRTLTELVESAGYRTLVLGSSKDPNAKVTILLLPPDGDTALFAVKVPTSAAAERAVRAEASALRSLREIGLGVVEDTLPQVDELVEHRGMTALVMNALPGLPLSRLYAERRHTGSRSRVGRDFAVVGEWLRAFQEATLRDGASEPARTGDRIRAR